MSHPNRPTLSNELRDEYQSLDRSCRARLGTSAFMFRTAKFVFYVAVLLFTVYLIEATAVSTMVALGLSVLFISGPEGLEAYLVRQDVLADPNNEE